MGRGIQGLLQALIQIIDPQGAFFMGANTWISCNGSCAQLCGLAAIEGNKPADHRLLFLHGLKAEILQPFQDGHLALVDPVALVTMALRPDWRKISVRRTTGIWPESTYPAIRFQAPQRAAGRCLPP